ERACERLAMRKVEVGVAGRQRRGHMGVKAIQMRREGDRGCQRRPQDHLIALTAAHECQNGLHPALPSAHSRGLAPLRRLISLTLANASCEKPHRWPADRRPVWDEGNI